MSERISVLLLMPDRIIDGFDLEIEHDPTKVTLIKDSSHDRGRTMFDITRLKANEFDFQILVPYNRSFPSPRKK